VRPGGLLVLSGIIADREPQTRDVFDAHGLSLVRRRQEEDWVSLIYQKPV
jgi:ribosomal protein L11 methyltransferase